MKKALILAIGLLMLFSISSFASETRTLVMGDNNMIMVDDYNIFMFPGRVNNYPNLALGEFDYNFGNEFYDFGITWQFNDDNPWVLGTFVSRLFATATNTKILPLLRKNPSASTLSHLVSLKPLQASGMWRCSS